MKKKKLRHLKPAPSQRINLVESLPLQVAALALFVWVAYWNSLGGGFHFDDQGIFLDSYILNPGFGRGIWRLTQTRPLTFLTFHWNYLAGGAAAEGFHAVNVLLHTANTILVLLIARLRLRGFLALFTGAVFALHPLQTQAVNYVFERATLLAAFFALLSLYCFLKEKYGWAIAAFGLSLLAKEETIALPAFLLLYEIVHKRHRVRWSHYAAMLLLALLATVRLSYALHMAPEARLGFGKGVSTISYALTQCRVLWIYLRLFLLPLGLNLDHQIEPSRGLFSPITTAPALLLLVLLIGALAWLAWRRNEPAFWALGFFVLLAPSSSIVPVIDLMFEHRTYFPLACLTMAVAALLSQVKRHLPAAALLVLIGALLVGTIVRNRIWHDDRSLWGDVVEKSPHKARGYFQLGQAYALQDPARARELYEHGLTIEPQNSIGQTNLGLILMSQNDLDGALAHFHQALTSGGENPTVWNNIGAAELRHDHVEEGIGAFHRALEIDPCRFDARMNLMRAVAAVEGNERAFLVGQIPETCHLLPEQAQKLEEERRSLR